MRRRTLRDTAETCRHTWTYIAAAIAMSGAIGCGSSSGSSSQQDASTTESDATDDADAALDDAPSDTVTGSFACAGSADPATAPMTLTLSGKITIAQADGTAVPASNLNISLVRLPNTSLNTGTTDGAGDFSLSFSSQGSPVEASARPAAPPQALGARVFFGRPLFEDRVFDMQLLSTAKFDKNYADAGVTRLGGRGYTIVTVRDCDGVPVVGATVTSSAATTIVYDGATGIPSAAATSTAADGVAHLLNLTSGDTTVAATMGSVTFRSRAIAAFSGEVTLLELVP